MPKYGVEIGIDVTKIEKARLQQANNGGKYLNMTVFIDTDNPDQYGQHGMVVHKKNQGEQQTPILGNVKVFWSDQGQPSPQSQGYTQAPGQPPAQPQSTGKYDDFDSDIPF